MLTSQPMLAVLPSKQITISSAAHQPASASQYCQANTHYLTCCSPSSQCLQSCQANTHYLNGLLTNARSIAQQAPTISLAAHQPASAGSIAQQAPTISVCCSAVLPNKQSLLYHLLLSNQPVLAVLPSKHPPCQLLPTNQSMFAVLPSKHALSQLLAHQPASARTIA